MSLEDDLRRSVRGEVRFDAGSHALRSRLADGFSCREQIAQATGRRALHLAQVVRREGGFDG